MGLLRNYASTSLLGRYSSFHSIEEIISEVIELIMKSERLKRLLYYTDKQALNLPQINSRQMMELLKQIKTVPKLDTDEYAKPYIIITLTNFYPESIGSEYRDFEMNFDIVCSYDQWKLADYKLRPYAIAGEIDALINKSHINKNGIADFLSGKLLILNNELGGLTLTYLVHSVGKDIILHNEEEAEE